MVMVTGEPVNSWGGGHAARPGASRTAARLANISTLLAPGQESKPATTTVVSCESLVSPPPRLSGNLPIAAQESRGHRESRREAVSSKAFRTALSRVYRVWTTSHESNQ